MRPFSNSHTSHTHHRTSLPRMFIVPSAKEGFATSWIRDAMPFFTGERSFFVVDPAGFKGINCRFGMKGVVAAGAHVHYM